MKGCNRVATTFDVNEVILRAKYSVVFTLQSVSCDRYMCAETEQENVKIDQFSSSIS